MRHLKQVYTSVLIFLLLNLIFSMGFFKGKNQILAKEITNYSPEMLATPEENIIVEKMTDKSPTIKKSKKWLWTAIAGAAVAGLAIAFSGSDDKSDGGNNPRPVGDEGDVTITW